MTADPIARLTGVPLADFAASYWGIAPLFRSAADSHETGTDELLSLRAVDELVSQRGLRTPFARMSRDGELLASARFTRGGGAGAEIADQLADDKVLAEFGAGATLVLQGLHRTWEPLETFARALTTQLGHPVQVNAYVTPPRSAGFAPHYDVHDVFVVQFAGRKRWRIHEPVFESPLRDQPWQDRRSTVEARATEPPLIDRVMHPGDTLYLPRGYIHSAASLDDVSGHLTIGVHPVTRRFLADCILAVLSDDVELRRSIVAGADLSDERAIDADLTATVAAMHAAIDRFDRSAVARAVETHLAASSRPAPIGVLDQFAAARALGETDRVRVRSGLRTNVRVADGAILTLPDRELQFPQTHADALRSATSGDDVCANDLPGIDATHGRELLSQLLLQGVVVRA